MSARRTYVRSLALPAAVVGFSALAVGPALAHVGISPSEGAAGSYTVATLSVPHGCDGSATTEITVKIPEAINSVTPTRNANWDVVKNVVELAEPIEDAHGNEITERVDTVVYTARTPLPDGYRDAFELSFQVPDVAGETLSFPTVQKCEKGQTDWVEVAEDGAAEPDRPAPLFAVVEGSGDGHGASDDGHAAEAEETEADDDDDVASQGLALTGLGVGALGLLAGAVALVQGRRKS